MAEPRVLVRLNRHHLRHAALEALLLDGGPLHVQEIGARLEAMGFSCERDPGRAVSDALRTELKARRVVRVDHGVYLALAVTDEHRRWMRRSLLARIEGDPSPRRSFRLSGDRRRP